MKYKPEPGVTAKTRGDTVHRIQDFMLPGLFLGVNAFDEQKTLALWYVNTTSSSSNLTGVETK